MGQYPFDMIRTIARNFYIRPKEWLHSGMDWTPDNDVWEKLSEQERQPWYDIAVQWLNAWKEQSPQLYQYYMENWNPDMNTEGYNNLIDLRAIAF